MIEILHDLIYQNPRNSVSMEENVWSYRMYVISSITVVVVVVVVVAILAVIVILNIVGTVTIIILTMIIMIIEVLPVWKIIAFWAMLNGYVPLFYIL